MRKFIYIACLAMIFVSCDSDTHNNEGNNSSSEELIIEGASDKGVKFTSSENGLVCKEVIIKIDGQTDDRNVITHGEKVVISFEGISGFSREEGSAFPGISLNLVNTVTGDTLFPKKDYLEFDVVGNSKGRVDLQSYYTAANPIDPNNSYSVVVDIWDKKSSKSYRFEKPVTIVDNKKLKITKTDISYNAIYFFDARTNKTINDYKFGVNEEIILLLEGIEGFTVENEMVFPMLSIELTDAEGKVIHSIPNFLVNMEDTGVNIDALKKQFPVYFRVSESMFTNPVTYKAVLTDKNSVVKLEIETEIIIK